MDHTRTSIVIRSLLPPLSYSSVSPPCYQVAIANCWHHSPLASHVCRQHPSMCCVHASLARKRWCEQMQFKTLHLDLQPLTFTRMQTLVQVHLSSTLFWWHSLMSLASFGTLNISEHANGDMRRKCALGSVFVLPWLFTDDLVSKWRNLSVSSYPTTDAARTNVKA